MSDICPECGQRKQDAHKEVLNRMKLTMLQSAAAHVMQTMRNDFKVYDFANDRQFKTYHNFQKLRYHGLITPVKDPLGRRIRARWLITRNGWSFLRGEKELPKYVLVQHNLIIKHAPELVYMKDVYYGADYIQTTFEYFDGAGNPVGVRPGVKHNGQLMLV
jgi:hypothetical protein